MDRLVFTANMAMSEYRLDRQNMTHELANVSTPGFKKAFQLANRAIRTEGDGFDTRYLPRAVTSQVEVVKEVQKIIELIEVFEMEAEVCMENLLEVQRKMKIRKADSAWNECAARMTR